MIERKCGVFDLTETFSHFGHGDVFEIEGLVGVHEDVGVSRCIFAKHLHDG